MPTKRQVKRFGWIPDIPDHRDRLYAAPPAFIELPPVVDLRPNFPFDPYQQAELGSCHDDKTQVLTRTGWKLFSELREEEELATVSPLTREVSYDKPTRIVRIPFKGELVCSQTKYTNFRVTPDHKMLVRPWNSQQRILKGEYELVPAEKIGFYSGLMNRVVWEGSNQEEFYNLEGVEHKRKSYRESVSVPKRLIMRFLGIFLAEGTLLYGHKTRVSYGVQLTAVKERERSFIRELMDNMGISYTELPDRFKFDDKRIHLWLCGLGFHKVHAPQKFVPSFVFEESAQMIQEFLLGHFVGDGSEDKGGVRAHYTSSKQLADDLQRLIFLSGNESVLSSRETRNSVMVDGRVVQGRYPEYRVSVCEKKNLILDRKKQVSREFYEGEVFCAEVPTHHTLVTRREGKILISGNCTANAIGAAIEYNQVKQGVPHSTPSRLFIYYNERVLLGTIEEDSGAMLRDGIKTVAKEGAPPEDLWPYHIQKFRDKPSKETYDEAKKYQVVLYQRISRDLNQMKTCLATGFPFCFGFTVFPFFESREVARTGIVPMPKSDDEVFGGHAVLAVGYDDEKQHFIFRNSYGKGWGDKGYGYIPYTYLTQSSLSADFWTIRFVETGG